MRCRFQTSLEEDEKRDFLASNNSVCSRVSMPDVLTISDVPTHTVQGGVAAPLIGGKLHLKRKMRCHCQL